MLKINNIQFKHILSCIKLYLIKNNIYFTCSIRPMRFLINAPRTMPPKMFKLTKQTSGENRSHYWGIILGVQ